MLARSHYGQRLLAEAGLKSCPGFILRLRSIWRAAEMRRTTTVVARAGSFRTEVPQDGSDVREEFVSN